jgi:putative component of toxin-antitoxin plasmid stabilization module
MQWISWEINHEIQTRGRSRGRSCRKWRAGSRDRVCRNRVTGRIKRSRGGTRGCPTSIKDIVLESREH